MSASRSVPCMGLDPLDILFRVEHAFKIKIPMSDFVAVYQAGRVEVLHLYIVGRLRQHRFRRCLGPFVFDRIRRAQADLFVGRAQDVMPWTATETLIPVSDRRKVWIELGQHLDLWLPPLRRPRWIESTLLSRRLVSLTLLPLTFFVPVIWPVTCLSWLFLVGSIFLTRPWATHIPPECATVKDMVRFLLRCQYGRIAERENGFEEQEVWQALRSVI